MSIYDNRPCPCGSGRPSYWKMDARGIPLSRVCPECEQERLAKFRPEVLTNPNYQTDEPIEEDE